MTNKEAHEEAAGMQLDDWFFRINGIDPTGEYAEPETEEGLASGKDIGTHS